MNHFVGNINDPFNILIFQLTFKGALRVARTVFEDVIVPKVNVVVVSVLALQQIENVIQMFVGIVGSGEFEVFFQSFIKMLFTA